MTTLQSVDSASKIGAYTGPESGIAQDDNIKAAVDLVKTDTEAVIVDGTQAATQTAMDEKCISVDLASLAAGANVLFTVAGGPIKLIEIVGIVTTGIQAQSTLIGYNVAVTV
ncbi:hypothetical protein KAT92_06795, partial [Candidatus Babeliales bacterium]|nr:hypothetical protein [Candidatus Babeliales bacterium]